MIKKLTLTGILVSAMLLTGCGGSSSGEESAKDILLGKTLYSADQTLDEPTGYYQDIYSATTITETEHAEDGTQIYQPIVLQVSYNNKNIIVSSGSKTIVCNVSKSATGVIFDCDNNEKFQQWYNISDILR